MWARLAAHTIADARAIGLATERALAVSGIDAGALEDPDARVPLESFYVLLEALEVESGDPLIAMRIASRIDVTHFDALGLLVLASPTLGRALDAMLRYQRMWSEGERWTAERGERYCVIRYEPFGPPRRAHELMAEMGALDIAVNAAAMCGGPFEGARVRLRHAIADPEEHARLLGGIRAESPAPADEIWLPRRVLDRPISTGHEAMYAFFERHLAERVRLLDASTWSARVRDRLVLELPREPSLAHLARTLGASPRTLQRHLAEEGTTLRELAEEARRAQAFTLLDAGASIAEIAYLLGYSEPSAFHRAFRRWTGLTPQQFRARRHA